MKLTVFELDGDAVRARVTTEPAWKPINQWDGRPVTGMQGFDVLDTAGATVQLTHIGAGGHFVMHAAPTLVICQVIHGRGMLGFPDGGRVAYHGPELYVFQPGTPHEWTDVAQETLLSACILH